MNKARILLLVLVCLTVGAFLLLDLGRFLNLAYLQDRLAELETAVTGHFWLSSLIFALSYIVLAALSVPGAAAVMTLSAGALFGLVSGSVLASFASAIGATLACLISRFLLRDFVERRFPTQAARANEGIRRDGAYYLFGLRLVPIFPFFVINLVMALTRLPLHTFYWVSQVGMLPGTVVYVNAGTQLAKIESAGDVLSPEVAVSLTLLGIFPLLARKTGDAVMAWHRRHP